MLFISALLFASSIFAKNLLLTPKEHHFRTFDFKSFVVEHNLENLVSINDLTIYKTTSVNYDLFKGTLHELFDVEEDLIYTLPKLIVKDNIIFVQEQGQTEFKIQKSVPWHLDRMSKRNLPLDGEFPYSESKSCHKNKDITIHTYIVDTGIDIEHPEFEGRAVWLENFSGDNKNTDCNSHGTHCAGLVGSKSYGLCKDANLFAVKVLNCEGSGSYSGILSGLEFVYKRHLKESVKDNGIRSVVSMSLGGGFSKAINRAVENLIKSDTMYVAVASGNEDSDACSTSPASARGVFTINAMDRYDNRAYFSNFGKCTDMYSPGVDILSTIPGGNTAVYSGTSMATPALVGVMNHVLDENPHLNMKQLKEKMMSDATKNTINGNPKETNNLLVYLHREN
jgi:subtilisin family serine protease